MAQGCVAGSTDQANCLFSEMAEEFSGIVGMIFTLILLIGLSRIAELVILDQRLSAETVNSVRMLSVASHNQDPAFMDQIISQLATEFQRYE